MARRTSNSSKTTSLSKMAGGGPIKGVPEISLKMREEKQRIDQMNAKFEAKIQSVRSNIPMNSHVRSSQNTLMDNYRRFASKYNGTKPKLDPLVKKHVVK